VCFLGFETDPASLSVVDALPSATLPNLLGSPQHDVGQDESASRVRQLGGLS
jgi:hypothetical protein